MGSEEGRKKANEDKNKSEREKVRRESTVPKCFIDSRWAESIANGETEREREREREGDDERQRKEER